MMNNVTLGQYFPGDSFLYRLDPRMKMLLTITLIVVVFVTKRFVGFALLLLFIIWCAISTKIGLKYMFKGLKPLFVIIALTFVLNLFLMKDGAVLVKLWFIEITSGGLRMALFMAARIILLVLCSQMLTFTTSPISLTDGLESLMRPLSRVGFPAHEISMMMSIALRFIPTLMEEAGKIRRAQMAFRRADELAMAMDARCYRGAQGRTRMKQLRLTWRDGVAAAAVAGMLALTLVLNRMPLI